LFLGLASHNKRCSNWPDTWSNLQEREAESAGSGGASYDIMQSVDQTIDSVSVVFNRALNATRSFVFLVFAKKTLCRFWHRNN